MRGGESRDDLQRTPLLRLDRVHKHYALPRERLFAPAPRVDALNGVDLDIRAGTNLGLVGESGSGKSTLARLAMALERPSAGHVWFGGRDLNALSAAELRLARRDFQMVFQDPYGSLDPRQRIGRVVAEPLLQDAATTTATACVAEALEAVGLRASDAGKYPHEFSGGQRQRIAIARALITRPRLIVADEPVSALDVSVQAQVLNLLQDLQEQFGVTYLLISHDLAVVDHLCDDVAVLYAGRVIEQGPPDVLFTSAAHPYTRALLRSVLAPEVTAPRSRQTASGAVTASLTVAAEGGDDGCVYAPRCRHRQPICGAEAPDLRPLGAGHRAACHFAEDVMNADHAPQETP